MLEARDKAKTSVRSGSADIEGKRGNGKKKKGYNKDTTIITALS